jgi:hypothetical protein
MIFGNSMLKHRCECGNLKRPLPTEEQGAECGYLWAFRCDECMQRLTGEPSGTQRSREFLEQVEECLFERNRNDPIFERQLRGLADPQDVKQSAA